ncbi:hypothetical protein [Roseivirga pacifica]|uniref:hypothetical protein n=1 Tax=Roseivirga pacifica TaxID=1267423 RepID=UPI00227BF8FC|nr:hypothetical protein [Roseivirga pacifica]
MKINKTILLLVLSVIPMLSQAQSEKSQELGLVFSGTSNFGLTYRFGKEQSLWRVELLQVTSLKRNLLSGAEIESTGFATTLGKEFRKPINDVLTFRYGLDLGFSYYSFENESDNNRYKTTSTDPFVQGVIGVNFKVSQQLLIGMEILPNIGYHVIKTEDEGDALPEPIYSETRIMSFQLNNLSRLSLVYQF